MFDELDKKDMAPVGGFKPAGPTPVKAEDIFSEVDKSTKPEALRPIGNNPLYPPETVIPSEDGWLKNKKMIFGLIIGVIVIIIAGFFVLRLMIKNTSSTTQIKEEVKNTEVTPVVTEPAAEEVNNVINQPIEPTVTAPLDSDQDGLTDEEEVTLGADFNSPDTDQDGLTDREEVKVYGTDPLKADTDGDGYIDGEEVKGGFNPKGPGKLLDINNQEQ